MLRVSWCRCTWRWTAKTGHSPWPWPREVFHSYLFRIHIDSFINFLNLYFFYPFFLKKNNDNCLFFFFFVRRLCCHCRVIVPQGIVGQCMCVEQEGWKIQ